MIVCLGVFLVVVSPRISVLRSSKEYAEAAAFSDKVKILLRGHVDTGKRKATLKLDRLNRARYTGIVYRGTNKTGHVYFRPDYAAPFALVPRFLWRGKPLIGSADGTPSGHLSWLAGQWSDSTRGTSVSRGPAAKPYWQFGFIGHCGSREQVIF